MKSFYEKNMFSIILAWHCSLTIGFSLPTLLSALVYTKNSNTKKKALKRYLNTGAHLASWHMGDIFDPTTKAFTSLQFVRGYMRVFAKEWTKQNLDKHGYLCTIWHVFNPVLWVQLQFYHKNLLYMVPRKS